MAEIITAGICFCIAVAAFVFSARSFREKGFLLNNAYLYASQKQRETMDKRPYYRQSAVVFLLAGILFALNGFYALLLRGWLLALVAVTALVTLVYAISSSVAIQRRKKQEGI